MVRKRKKGNRGALRHWNPNRRQKVKKRLYDRDGGICHLCDRIVIWTEEVSFDHVIPLSKGGRKGAANLKLAHISCNNKRGDDDLE